MLDLSSFKDLYFDKEAIDFQIDSKVPEVIDKYMTMLFDYCRTWDADYGLTDGEGIEDHTTALTKYTDVAEYFMTHIDKPFKKTLLDEFGMKIEKFVLQKPTSDSHITSVYVGFGKFDATTEKGIGLANGSIEDEITDIDIERLDKISRSIDKKKGHIKELISCYNFHIGIPLGLFCLRDVIPKNKAVKLQPTPREITAPLLHEIGHIFSWFEQMSNLSYTGMYGNNAFKSLRKEFDKDPAAVVKSIDKQVSKSKVSDKMKDYSKYLVNQIDTYALNESKYAKPLKIAVLAIVYFFLFFFMVGLLAVYSGLDILLGPVLFPTNSSSKVVDTVRNDQMFERMADEFVSRFGRSKDLNNALIKINGIFSYFGFNTDLIARTNNAQRYSKGISFVNTLLSSTMSLPIKLLNQVITGGESTYEPDRIRMKRNISNMYDVLNQYDLPPSVRKEIVADIDLMKKDFDRWKYSKDRLNMNALVECLCLPEKVVKGLIGDMLATGTLNKDYRRVFDSVDQILSSRGGYYASKFEDLI